LLQPVASNKLASRGPDSQPTDPLWSRFNIVNPYDEKLIS
jgi:hypothetical protein